MVKNILLLLFVSICLSAAAQKPKFKVVTVDLSKGNSPGKEYVELLVVGHKTCDETLGGDSIANLTHFVLFDTNGDSTYSIKGNTVPGIVSGKYRFPAAHPWDSIPYGTMIVIYNGLEENNKVGKDNYKGIGGTYIIPVSALERFDSDTTSAPLDSILPVPTSINLQEGFNAYIKNPVQPPYINDPNNWGVEAVGGTSRFETPGYFVTDVLNGWRNQIGASAIFPLKISLKTLPPTYVSFNGVVDTVLYCPSIFSFVGSAHMANISDANLLKTLTFKWYVNGVEDSIFTATDTLPNRSDSLLKYIHQDNKVIFSVSTSLKCISGSDSLVAGYKAFNVYPDGDTLKVLIKADSTFPLVDTLGRDAFGNIDSAISYKTFCSGSVTKFSPLPNNSGKSDLYTWLMNGKIVGVDSVFVDSAIHWTPTHNKDTIYCVLNSSLHCVDKPKDTTTIILTILDSIPLPTLTISGDTAVCSSSIDSFFAKLNYSSPKRDTSSRYNLVWVGYDGLGSTLYNDALTYKDGDTLAPFTTGVFQPGLDSIKVILLAKKTQSCPYYDSTVLVPGIALSDTSAAYTINVTQTITPVIKILTPTQTGLCPDSILQRLHVQDTILFTAVTDTISAGTNPKYHWFVNGKEITDSTLLTFRKDTTTFLSKGGLHDSDVISVILINTTYKCVTSDSARDSLQMFTFNPLPTPTVSMDKPVNFCALDNLTGHVFTVSGLSNQGTHPSYQWYAGTSLPLQLVSQNDTYFDKQIINYDSIYLIFTSSVACATPKTLTDGFKIKIDNPYTASIAIDSTINSKTVCQNSSFTLIVSPDDKSLNNPSTNFDIYINGNFYQNTFLPISISAANMSLGLNSIYLVMHSGVTCLANPLDTSNVFNITVYSVPLVNPIAGELVGDGTLPPAVCVGSYKGVSETTLGGVWSTSPSIALKVDSFSVFNGIDSAKITGLDINNGNPATVTYTVTDPTTGCKGTANISVIINMNSIPMDSMIYKYRCTSAPMNIDTIFNISSQGYWTSSDNNIATVQPFTFVDINGITQNAVIVTALNNGQVYIYDSIYTPDCGTTIRTDTLIIGPPIIDSITGNNTICLIPNGQTQMKGYAHGDTSHLWASDTPGVATIDNNGLVNSVTAGTTNIIYTAYNTCGASAPSIPFNIAVGPPTNAGNINGTSILCVGSKTTNNPFTNNINGGYWTTKDTLIAQIDSTTGVAIGKLIGSDSILYTVANKCGSIHTSWPVTITGTPAKFPITSQDSVVCISAGKNTLQMSNAVTGGVWESSSPNMATIDQNSGLVTGLTSGIDTIKYTVTQTCGSYTVDTIIIVGGPLKGAYTFNSPICAKDTIRVSNDTRGANSFAWSVFNQTGNVLSIVDGSHAVGVFKGVNGGNATILYVAFNTKCASSTFTDFKDSTNYVKIQVNDLPVVPSIVGKSVLCLNDTTTLTNASAIKGVWSVDSIKTATIDSKGFLTAMGAGTATIGYKVTDTGTFCHDSTSLPIKINSLPKVPAIGGLNAVCYGRTIVLKDSAAIGATGYWQSLDPTIARITNIDTVLGISPGSTTIKYLVIDGNSCRDSVSTPITVNAIPTIGAIGGVVDSICIGNTAQLTDAGTGGVWAISNGSASITPTGSLTGLFVGIDTISYKITTLGCDTAVSLPIRVTTPFIAPIVVVDSLIIPVGLTLRFTDTTPNGTWSLNPGSRNSVSGDVTFTGGFPGTDTLRYTVLSAGCKASVDTVITVLNPLNDIYVPNFFNPYSPNKENQTFMVLGKLMSAVDFKVFSPWGALMYHTNDINAAGWDGKFNGQEMPTGVYVYTARITVIDVNNKVTIINKKGAVNLIR